MVSLPDHAATRLRLLALRNCPECGATFGHSSVCTHDRTSPKSVRLKRLAIAAYHAASTPTEAKMAGILCDLYAPEMSE